MSIASADVETKDEAEFVSAREAARLSGLPPKSIARIAEQGYLDVRLGIGDVPARYSRASCLALRDQLVRKATKQVTAPVGTGKGA